MHFLRATSVAFFLLADSALADFLTARSLDHGENVDLGYLEDVNLFYSTIGFDPASNTSYWEDASELETFDLEDVFEGLTGIVKDICNNVPSRWWFWGTGGVLLIYYSPKLMENFLVNLAAAIRAGQDVRRAVVGNDNGGVQRNPSGGDVEHGELKRRSNGTAIDYHFSLPYILDGHGNPMHYDVVKRDTVEDDGTETKFTHDYVYSEAEETIYYKSTAASFSSSMMDNSTGIAGHARRSTSDYTLHIEIKKHSKANTVAEVGCLAAMLKNHVDASSESQRFSCRPIDNRGSWHANMHTMINHGRNNFGYYGDCC
ncbi:hypothetical protein Q7P37_009097 [Cladosporium fusiforme]